MKAVALAVALLVVAAAPAEAKRKHAFGAKAASSSKQRGWRAIKPPGTVPLAIQPQDAAPVEPAGAPAEQPAAAAPPPPPPAAPLCDPSPWLGVTAEDANGFRLRLTRPCVPAGTVLFQFRNRDLSVHNLWAEGVAPVRAPREVVGEAEGETTVHASEALAAGKWRLYCSLNGHETMTRVVDVTPSSR